MTNDLVKLKSKKDFVLLGRADNVINSGGVKVIPEEVEQLLSLQIEQDFFISSIPDDSLGERIIIVVEGALSPTLLTEISSANILTKYQLPKKAFQVSKFIRTENGKIKRKETCALLDL